ncbi:hypothetical protein [Fortiea contorta]|uniref:hypothetical protein n=1 Tax=Fortiea contorta TaxID=1892405 RepID=UPI00034DC3F3|nr:hypothetical protein [Fortiea contorta]
MNDADASNQGAFMESPNSANLPSPEQASCPFYAVAPHEILAIPKLPLLQPAKDKPHTTEVPKLSENTTTQDWIAEPERDKQALIDTEFQQLLALNEELRSANNALYEQVEQLKGDLTESEKALQWHKRRSSITESMLNQQTQELAAAQEQIQSLFQQLETAGQTIQRQESSIETHKSQLQISQQRVAQLERECAILQTNYTEQSQHLSQAEIAGREMRTRLMRQQRQTLQYKAALEKCLESPVPGADFTEDYPQQTRQTRFSRKARSLFPNAQPIKPWSGEPDFLNDNLENFWEQGATESGFSNNEPIFTPSSPWDWPHRETTPIQPIPTTEEVPTTPPTVSSVESSTIDEQLDTLIQMFFASQSAPPPVTEPNLENHQASDAVVWETLATTITDYQEPEAQTQPWMEDITPPIAADPPHTQTNLSTENEDYWSEIAQLNQGEFSPIDLSQDLLGDLHLDTQSPSPVVYPQRPPKGRKTLASVELPNFRQNSQ